MYKPPTTLAGMVSGLWTEGEEASGQMNKAVLTNKLSINTENGGPAEKGILATSGLRRMGGTFLHLSCYGVTAGARHSHKGSFRHKCNRKGGWVETVILCPVANSRP